MLDQEREKDPVEVIGSICERFQLPEHIRQNPDLLYSRAMKVEATESFEEAKEQILRSVSLASAGLCGITLGTANRIFLNCATKRGHSVRGILDSLEEEGTLVCLHTLDNTVLFFHADLYEALEQDFLSSPEKGFSDALHFIQYKNAEKEERRKSIRERIRSLNADPGALHE